MNRYVIESWLLLLFFECVMRFRSFKALHEMIRRQKVRPINSAGDPSSETLCRAVDLACVLYFKQVLCLQRSSATTLLLRRYGWEAEMVIGAQMLPFKSHAWVEIKGAIVNDKPYMLDIYRVLDRC
jgi:hypothetical protein